MEIIRYSVAAFEPQKQTHRAKDIYYHFYGGFNIEDYPEFMRWQIQRIHEQKGYFLQRTLGRFKMWNLVFCGWTQKQSIIESSEEESSVLGG